MIKTEITLGLLLLGSVILFLTLTIVLFFLSCIECLNTSEGNSFFPIYLGIYLICNTFMLICLLSMLFTLSPEEYYQENMICKLYLFRYRQPFKFKFSCLLSYNSIWFGIQICLFMICLGIFYNKILKKYVNEFFLCCLLFVSSLVEILLINLKISPF